ncbi:helix-turn-helix domain-containing protein [Paraburkholderia sp. GAS82]|jgi:transcriptional regulator with XRE-family HTH domain|uniref:helix-turn-helix domain-containing protein n=1 Tax=Paraburkholderia sp. GAS82 TaxID=3035137 RepID=UPI003D20C1AE
MKSAPSGGDALAKRVGAAIAFHRKQAGFTQIRVADSLGLEKETVSRIENGVISPTLNRLAQFADLFRCPVSALFGEYRGKPIEDAAEIAEALSGLSLEDRRVILRIVADIASMARERAILREREALEKAVPMPEGKAKRRKL